MKIKTGVQVGGIRPEMTLALMIVEPILKSYDQELVITSCCDSRHSKNSRHYIGQGLDLRSRDIPSPLDREKVVKEMREALGAEYYVVFEVHHFHLQFNGSQR